MPELEDAGTKRVPPVLVVAHEPLRLEGPQQAKRGGNAQLDAPGDPGQRLGRLGGCQRRQHADRPLDSADAVSIVFHRVKGAFRSMMG